MTTGYGAARARQVRVLLWVTVAVSLVAVLFAAVVVLQGALRFGLFVGVPGLGALVTAALAVLRLDSGGAARPLAATAGALITLVGLVAASLALGFVAIILGVLMVVVAVLPEPQDEGGVS